MKTFFRFTVPLLAALAGLAGCAVNPVCPTALLPIVEVQVNNSASTHDDYIGTATSTPCRARIVNVNRFNGGLNFPGGVEVEVRNRRLSTDLNIATTSGGTGSFFFTTLPGDGSWMDFFIRGTAVSTADKGAILEIATAGVSCNEVALSRKGLMVTASPPIPGSRPQLEIEVGSVSNLDDYITWAPTTGRMKWANPSGTTPLGVTVRNQSPSNRLRFANTAPATNTTATGTTTTLSLPVDGSWVNFYVAGNYGNASQDDKDAVFEVVETGSGNLLAREGLMVRIRKNVNALAPRERDRYLEALRDVHDTYNFFMLFRNSHSQGLPASTIMHLQAHQGSAFLPWHRAFVLHFERLLQASDPSVALPYWHFDQVSSGMFNPSFVGSNNPDPLNPNMVVLAPSNPIFSWTIPGSITGIRRRTPYGDSGIPSSTTGTTTGVALEEDVLGLGETIGSPYSSFKTMEGAVHNGAHNNSGNTVSWIADLPSIAPQDPLFYFLHCNVDRLWGKWQDTYTRYDGAQATTYDRQGSFTAPAVAGQRLGQYIDDALWPWDNVTGTSAGTGLAVRPTTAPLTPFPIVLGTFMPGSKPTIKLTLDPRTMNFAYDDYNPY